ncbi:septum site-determining protein MinC [Stenotrophobium rhamnosiphilum]|uniref:Probable septum site-determining protein MinC n=1 Tax=Stenotrophobium rhamnosiphilum TaxID=2029166 RepID=A0A2T5MJ39_9GAMM|nr:septum site-determining protein MinC [Stenotrophobium rhamnosiphilum]PTU32597.1 septum site-determining protein MinC [Stenotrophobium rhamnosiphilum]
MPSAKKVLEFKGRMLSLTRVRVLDSDPHAIEAQLREFAKQMPQAVAGMPVILESDTALDLGGLLSILKSVGMQPVGVSDGPLAESARNWGLPVLPPDTGKTARAIPEAAAPAPAAAAAAPTIVAAKPPKIITTPVRSGQQIYAEGGDLIIINTVSPGAEVIADGCVHVYGTLRGRAIAGAKGDTTARVFCRRFEADLVAICGIYAVAEQMQGELRNKPAQAYLVDGKLKLDRLDW